jgi:hypothetical protein
LFKQNKTLITYRQFCVAEGNGNGTDRPCSTSATYYVSVGNSYTVFVGRDSSVDIVTCYGLGGPGTESRRGRDFPHPSRPVLGPIQLPCNEYRVSLPRVERKRRGLDHPPTSKAELRESAELEPYSPFKPSWPGLGFAFTLFSILIL